MKPMMIKRFLMLMLIAIFAHPAITGAGDGHDHGHDHGPAAASTDRALPVVVAVSENYELVGRLVANELTIFIDRAATNEPVLNATLALEVGNQAVNAVFHADHGDYAVTDVEMLKALNKPGVKALTFTLTTSDDTDLLAGELDIHEDVAANSHRSNWKRNALWIIGIVLALTLILVAIGLRAKHIAEKQRISLKRGAV